MVSRQCVRVLGFVSSLVLLACGAPTPSSGGPPTTDRQQPAAPKRIVAAITGDPQSLYWRANSISGSFGIDALAELTNVGLVIRDNQGRLFPRLAESVPSVDNGLWKVFPDGRMEMTWKIKEGAQWHDGTPFTSADLAFTVALAQDKSLVAVLGDVAFDSLDSFDAPDSRTFTVRLKSPFIQADALFSPGRKRTLPLPKHLLDSVYAADPASFMAAPYWTDGFVGTGPYKLREWVKGSNLVLEAHDHYALGRPRIDTIEVRIIPDVNTLISSVLARAVDVTIGRAVPFEQALPLRDQWSEGRVDLGFTGWIAVYPQFINPNPPVLADVRLRRALLHAIDRQQMVDELAGGRSTIAHALISPGQAEYGDVESAAVRYEYDQRKAAQLIEEIGHARGSDGVFRDA